MTESYDVAVVGAGPAGSTVSKILAEQGFNTIVIDRKSRIGVPVQCGELIPTPTEAHRLFPKSKIMPQAIHVHSKFITNKTRAIRLISPNGSVFEFPFEANIVDRARFDQHLASLAENEGARFLLGSIVKRRSSTNELTFTNDGSENSIKAKFVVGADGAHSIVAKSLGVNYIHNVANLSQSLQYVMSGVDVDPTVVEMHFGSEIAPGGYAWVIPKGDRVANIGFGMRRSIAKDNVPLRTYLDRFVFKTIASSLKNFKIVSRVGAIIPVGGPLKKTWSKDVLLIGDAAGHVMASNGGGIPTALCGGVIAGYAISKHLNMDYPLSEYENKWRLEFGSELDTAVRVLKIADSVMPSDTNTDICMRLAGVKFLEPLIRCQLPLPVDLASKTLVKILNRFL